MAVTPSFNLLLLAGLAAAALVWVARIFLIRRFRQTNLPLEPVASLSIAPAPKISVIIPARNEEKNIGHCLTHLFKENYPNFEIIVVDDRSTDRTPHLLDNLQKLSTAPMKVVRIEKLPPGWTGKSHAMHAGAKAAAGDWFLFTDADTTHRPSSITTAVNEALRQKIDFLTLAAELESLTFWEKTVQPIAVGSLAIWFPIEAMANGQFILVSRKSYEAVGGGEAVKDKVVEDIELARAMRRAGFRTRLADGTKLYRTRMYTSLSGIVTGWTRILTHLFEKNIWKLTEKIGMFLFFSIFPFAIFLGEIILRMRNSPHFSKEIFIFSGMVSALIVAIRFAGNRILKCDPWHAFTHPIGSIVMVWILLKCVGRILAGRPSVWKGERYAVWAMVLVLASGPAWAETREDVFLTGKDWRETMTMREKYMSLLPPVVLFDEYDIRLTHSLPEYIMLIDRIVRFNPDLEEEDVANIFTSAVYRFEPQSRVALKTMEMNFLQGNFEIKPLNGPRLSYQESEETIL